MRAILVTIVALAALSGCAALAQRPDLTRGEVLDDGDRPRITTEFLGLWATPHDACGVTRDYGVQILIDPTALGVVPVRRVRTYSDRPAVLVDLAEANNFGATSAVLVLSDQGRRMRIEWGGEEAAGKSLELHRCSRDIEQAVRKAYGLSKAE